MQLREWLTMDEDNLVIEKDGVPTRLETPVTVTLVDLPTVLNFRS
jgi:hypothetical protein